MLDTCRAELYGKVQSNVDNDFFNYYYIMVEENSTHINSQYQTGSDLPSAWGEGHVMYNSPKSFK